MIPGKNTAGMKAQWLDVLNRKNASGKLLARIGFLENAPVPNHLTVTEARQLASYMSEKDGT